MSDIKLKKRSGNIYLNQPDIYKEPTGSSSTKEVVVFLPKTDAEFVETVSKEQVSGLKNGKVTVNDESDGYKTVIIDSNPKTEIFSEKEQATTVQEELQNIEAVISSIPDFITTEIANGLIIDQTQLTNAVVEANEYANAANAYADNAEKEAEVACNQAQVAGEYAKISLQANVSAQTALTEINAKSSYIEMVSGIVATKADDINSKYNEINIISAGVELANANVLATSGMISNMLDEVKTVSTGIENVSNSFIEAADSRLSEMNEYVSEFETMSSGMSGLYDSAVSTYESTYSAYEAVSTISGDLVNTFDEFSGIYSDFNDKWVNISSNFIAVSGSYDGKAGNNPVIEGTKVFQEPLSAGYDTADLTNQQRNTVVMTRRHAEEFASTKPVNKANYATVASDYIPLAGTNKNISYMVSSSVNGVIKSSTVTVSTPPLSGAIFASAQTGSPDVFVFGAMTTDSQAMRLCGGNAGLSGARVDLNGVNFISSGNKTILLNQNTADNTYAPARIVSSTEVGGTFTLATDANTGILFGSGTTLKWNGRRINEESVYNVLDYGICKNENGNLNGIAKPVKLVRMECPVEGTKGVDAHYAQPKFYDENGVIIASIADYDCSEAIQRAIDDCAYHGGGKVVLPVIKQGYSYLVTKTITVRNGVTLVSYGSTPDNGTSAETNLTYTNKTIIFYPSPIDDFSKKENVIDYSYKAGNVIGKETRASVASPITLSGTSVQIYDVRNDLKIPCIKCAGLNIIVENIGVVLCSPNTIGFKVNGDYSVTMRNCNVRAVADPSYSSFCISFLFNDAMAGVYENLHSHIGTLENFISRFGTIITTQSQAESTYPFDYKSNLVLDYRHFVFTGSVQRNTFIDLHANGIGTSFELYDGVSENSFIGISAEKTINSFLEVYNSYRNKFYNLRFINGVTKINDFSIYKVDTQYGIFFDDASIQNEINGLRYRYNSSSTDNASLYTNGNLFDLGNNVVRCNITDSMLDNDIQSNIKNTSRTNVLHTNYLYMIGKSGATVNDTTNTDTTTNTTTYLNNAIGVSGGAGLAFTGNSIVPVKNDLFTNSSANALKINHGGTVLSGVNLGNKYRPFENAYFKNVSISNNFSAGSGIFDNISVSSNINASSITVSSATVSKYLSAGSGVFNNVSVTSNINASSIFASSGTFNNVSVSSNINASSIFASSGTFNNVSVTSNINASSITVSSATVSKYLSAGSGVFNNVSVSSNINASSITVSSATVSKYLSAGSGVFNNVTVSSSLDAYNISYAQLSPKTNLYVWTADGWKELTASDGSAYNFVKNTEDGATRNAFSTVPSGNDLSKLYSKNDVIAYKKIVTNSDDNTTTETYPLYVFNGKTFVILSSYEYKGSVESKSKLKTSGNINDVYSIDDIGTANFNNINVNSSAFFGGITHFASNVSFGGPVNMPATVYSMNTGEFLYAKTNTDNLSGHYILEPGYIVSGASERTAVQTTISDKNLIYSTWKRFAYRVNTNPTTIACSVDSTYNTDVYIYVVNSTAQNPNSSTYTITNLEYASANNVKPTLNSLLFYRNRIDTSGNKEDGSYTETYKQHVIVANPTKISTTKTVNSIKYTSVTVELYNFSSSPKGYYETTSANSIATSNVFTANSALSTLNLYVPTDPQRNTAYQSPLYYDNGSSMVRITALTTNDGNGNYNFCTQDLEVVEDATDGKKQCVLVACAVSGTGKKQTLIKDEPNETNKYSSTYKTVAASPQKFFNKIIGSTDYINNDNGLSNHTDGSYSLGFLRFIGKYNSTGLAPRFFYNKSNNKWYNITDYCTNISIVDNDTALNDYEGQSWGLKNDDILLGFNTISDAVFQNNTVYKEYEFMADGMSQSDDDDYIGLVLASNIDNNEALNSVLYLYRTTRHQFLIINNSFLSCKTAGSEDSEKHSYYNRKNDIAGYYVDGDNENIVDNINTERHIIAKHHTVRYHKQHLLDNNKVVDEFNRTVMYSKSRYGTGDSSTKYNLPLPDGFEVDDKGIITETVYNGTLETVSDTYYKYGYGPTARAFNSYDKVGPADNSISYLSVRPDDMILANIFNCWPNNVQLKMCNPVIINGNKTVKKEITDATAFYDLITETETNTKTYTGYLIPVNTSLTYSLDKNSDYYNYITETEPLYKVETIIVENTSTNLQTITTTIYKYGDASIYKRIKVVNVPTNDVAYNKLQTKITKTLTTTNITDANGNITGYKPDITIDLLFHNRCWGGYGALALCTDALDDGNNNTVYITPTFDVIQGDTTGIKNAGTRIYVKKKYCKGNHFIKNFTTNTNKEPIDNVTPEYEDTPLTFNNYTINYDGDGKGKSYNEDTDLLLAEKGDYILIIKTAPYWTSTLTSTDTIDINTIFINLNTDVKSYKFLNAYNRESAIGYVACSQPLSRFSNIQFKSNDIYDISNNTVYSQTGLKSNGTWGGWTATKQPEKDFYTIISDDFGKGTMVYNDVTKSNYFVRTDANNIFTLSDDKKLPLTGGTITGNLIIKGSLTVTKDIKSGTPVQVTSDERRKEQIAEITDEVLDAWEDVNWISFKFKDSVLIKGDYARIHTGLIAQQIQKAFNKHGLDACDYGILCYDNKDDLWTVRYDEALSLETAYQRRENKKLKQMILDLLEEKA